MPTRTPTPTSTPTPTNTPAGPTSTPTRTNTPVGPTNTPTRTPTSTNTPSGCPSGDDFNRANSTNLGALHTDRRFTGQREETGLGSLYDYNARYYSPLSGRFISADRIVPEPGNPQSLNRYAYVLGNPIKYTDPSGHWIESAIDIAFIGYDIWDISQNGLNWENGLSLAADVAGLLLPVATGGGLAVRAAFHADDAAKALTHLDDLARAANAANQVGNLAQISKQANSLGDTSKQVLLGLSDRPKSKDFPTLADMWVHLKKQGIDTYLSPQWQDAGLSTVYPDVSKGTFAQAFGETMDNASKIHFDLTGFDHNSWLEAR